MRPLITRLTDTILPRGLRRALDDLEFSDGGHGYDRFGASKEWVRGAIALTRPLHDWYFRVESFGGQHIPATGPAILAANHSGTLPFDAAVLYGDVIRQTHPPRLPRNVADTFVPELPFVSTIFARLGVVSGTRRNVRALLEQGELLEIFPEGTPGISKPFPQRYQLQTWREGHAELAIRYRVPVVPVAIIGAEEQMPMLLKLRHVHPFAAPFLPIPATPLPLPVRYRIHYGEPLALHVGTEPADADDPAVVGAAALRVKQAVQALIDRGLDARKHVFW